jgi:hypothetical protein
MVIPVVLRVRSVGYRGGIHVLYTGEQQLILNLEECHLTVLSNLDSEYERLYVSPPTEGADCRVRGGVEDGV